MAERVGQKEIGLHSEIRSFGALLGGEYYFVMPYLQRPYEWGEAEVADMAGDLLLASDGGYLNYFLGHIVGVRNAQGQIEIVDGQQRFITTTILFAYFRDRVSARNGALAAALQDCVMKAGRVRVTPRPSDAAFLETWVQTPGRIDALTKDWGKEEPPYQTVTDAQALMVQAARTILGKLDRLGHEAVDKLAWFVLERAVVDFIIADNRTLAAILYRGMNMRGKQLSPADLIKLEAIEGTGLEPEVKESAARMWETVEDRLKRDNFAFLLEIMPLLVSRQATVRPGDLMEWRKHTFQTVDAETLLLQLLPVYADVFEEVMSGEVRYAPKDRGEEQALATVNRLLKGLLFLLPGDRHWVAPAISAVHAHRERPHFLASFFKGLDRLAFACFLDAVRHEDRAARFAEVVRAGADETQLSHAFSLRAAEASGMLRRLGEPFKRHTWRRRAVAARINAAFPAGYSFRPEADVTVEHILPTSASPAWAQRGWTAHAANACANIIGNFVLVTYAQNNRAGQKVFEEKHNIYFNWPGAPVHPITEDVRRNVEWTERHVRARTERLIAMLAADWDLA
ncbi:MAG: DUF262 domain-containing HNH endonuclease family protein [Hyphomonadaceae bacterium]|nr:DUF262 domain-containing HNH endonuclease family protein [Hyphomonadaceae bacterium]